MLEQLYTERVQFKAPPGFSAAMATLANRQGLTFSAAFRQLAINALHREGVKIDPTAPPPFSKDAKNGATKRALEAMKAAEVAP